jgi:3-deoxy-D-manno-octulosonate 8-phosphate phosphatase (KDO 8-P phosphatase)
LEKRGWKERARPIRLLLLDVDGVLTDGRIVFDATGGEIKFFDVKDGQGIQFLHSSGIEVGILSSRESLPVEKRARDLSISLVRQKVKDKAAELLVIQGEKNLRGEEIAYVGDDWVDLPVFSKVGLAVAVADSVPELKKKAHYVTRAPGGRGAVREVCEAILKAQGRWKRVTEKYFSR